MAVDQLTGRASYHVTSGYYSLTSERYHDIRRIRDINPHVHRDNAI